MADHSKGNHEVRIRKSLFTSSLPEYRKGKQNKTVQASKCRAISRAFFFLLSSVMAEAYLCGD
jgi:hypothetical protein